MISFKKEKLRIPTLESTIQKAFGKRPFLHHSHRVFLKLIKSLGGSFHTQSWGEEKIGVVIIPLRKTIRHSEMNNGAKNRLKGGPVRALKNLKRVVFMPGLGDSPVSWLPILLPIRGILKRDFDELVLIDFPGFGGFLSRSLAFDSMDRMLACTQDLLKRLSPDTIIGHSLGGWFATEYAIQNSQQVNKEKTDFPKLKKLILFSPSGIIGEDKSSEDWVTRFNRVTEEGFSPIRKHVFYKEPFWFKWMAPDVEKFLKSPEIVSFIRSIEKRHLVKDRLPLIEAKTFLLWGEKDTLIPSQWMKEWIAGLEPSTLASAIYMKRSGHSPHAEKPTVLTLLLGEIFLGKNILKKVPSAFWKFENSKERLQESDKKNSIQSSLKKGEKMFQDITDKVTLHLTQPLLRNRKKKAS